MQFVYCRPPLASVLWASAASVHSMYIVQGTTYCRPSCQCTVDLPVSVHTVDLPPVSVLWAPLPVYIMSVYSRPPLTVYSGPPPSPVATAVRPALTLATLPSAALQNVAARNLWLCLLYFTEHCTDPESWFRAFHFFERFSPLRAEHCFLQHCHTCTVYQLLHLAKCIHC